MSVHSIYTPDALPTAKDDTCKGCRGYITERESEDYMIHGVVVGWKKR
jgi:hypothetical protein